MPNSPSRSFLYFGTVNAVLLLIFIIVMQFEPTHIGIIAGIFTAVSLLPQLVKIIQQKKAEAVSVGMLLVLLTGLLLWIYYGILKTDLPIIITNAFSVLVNVLVIIFSLKYKNKVKGQNNGAPGE